MSEVKFTPGPWKKGFFMEDGKPKSLGVFEQSAIAGQTVNAICLVTNLDNAQSIDEFNADLIAAAPEMYEALVCLQTSVEWAKEQGANYVLTTDDIALINDALTKARGETTNQPEGTNNQQ